MARARAKYTIEAEDRTEQGLRSAEGRLRGFGRRIATVVGAAVAAVGTGLLAWGDAIRRAGEGLVDIKRTADEIAASVEEASALQFFADIQDVDLSQVVAGIERVRERIGELVAGEEAAVKLFAELGVQADDLVGKSGLTQLVTVGAAITGRAEPARRQRLVNELIGGGQGGLISGDFVGAAAQAGALVPQGLRPAVSAADQLSDQLQIAGRTIANEFSTAIFNSGFVQRLTEAAADFNAANARRGNDASSGEVILSQEKLVRELEALRSQLARSGSRFAP